MRVQEIEWMPSPPQANPLYEKMLKKVRQCGEAKDTARREWEEAEELLRIVRCCRLSSRKKSACIMRTLLRRLRRSRAVYLCTTLDFPLC